MFIVYFNKADDECKEIFSAENFRYDFAKYEFSYSHHEGANQILWEKIQKVSCDIDSRNNIYLTELTDAFFETEKEIA